MKGDFGNHAPQREEIEIERKWILTQLPEVSFDTVTKIEQYYKEWLRYRKETQEGFDSVFYCIKKQRIAPGISRETWHQCDRDDFNFNYPLDEKPIKKTRYAFSYQGKTIEIDTFENGLVMMEIEVKSLDEPIQIPRIIHEAIDREVTGDEEYSNYQLFRKFNNLEPTKSKFPGNKVIRQLKRNAFVNRNKYN